MRRHHCVALVLLRALALLSAETATAQSVGSCNPVTTFQQQPDGVLFVMKTGTLRVQVCTDSIVRVRYSATSTFSDRPDYVVTRTSWPETKWTMHSTTMT